MSSIANSTLLNNTQTTAAVDKSTGQSAGAFAASLVASIIAFGVQTGIFLLIKDRFSRIYQPRSYLVPERERTTPPRSGWWKWISPVLTTSSTELMQKCGLDAYFFLRYLRTLIKIFVPAACVILPILLPLNSVRGRGAAFAVGQYANYTNVTGLDQLAWGNVAPDRTNRYWAHWLLALALIIYVCYVAFDELRGYIRMRQAYLTSPQHRLRASATTVLVSSIPAKWCTVEALDGLYDVFPGGIRNIWINRNYDELNEKIQKRNNLAQALESAETELIKKCWKANEEKMAKAAKQAGKSKLSKKEKKIQDEAKDEKGMRNAQGNGLTSGNPHQVLHTVQDVVDDAAGGDGRRPASLSDEELALAKDQQHKASIPIPIFGEGVSALSQGVSKFSKSILGALNRVDREANNTFDTTNGFVPSAYAAVTSTPHQTEKTEQESKTDSSKHLRNEKKFAGAHATDQRASPSQITNDGGWDQGRTIVRSENDRQPLNQPSPTSPNMEEPPKSNPASKSKGMLKFIRNLPGFDNEEKEQVEYPEAYDEGFGKDPEKSTWRSYIQEKDRDTMRLPIFGWQWMISLPLIGEKVDTIYYCRKEVARLNVEIEDDQAHPERFPLMNSAFVQFNHQVAAHMACQTVSHHLPQQMAPRLVEIAPNDVIWENMSIPWWQNYIRTAVVISIVAALIVLWAIPVAFTSALSQIHYVADTYHWLRWLLKAPAWLLSVLQGILPALCLAILMALLPIILRFLVKMQGTQSGMLIELSVQRYYFFFLFVQIFLIVSIASAVSTLFGYISNISTITSVPTLLAVNLPKASNYFFSYMLLQALSTSAGALLQVGGLLSWFILAPLLDNTARSKFTRQTQLSEIQWGTFFPVYTNLACIGLIYSVISPLILVFNVITFSLFWFVYRYNTLYVTKFTRDTGGLLYPNAINTTFVGIYVMEVALIGLFFLVRDQTGRAACTGQGIGMVVILIITAIYQILLNMAFKPLFRYLPITLEDDAVRRDEEFSRAMAKRNGLLDDGDNDDEVQGEDIEDELERREKEEREENREAEEYEMQQIQDEKNRREHLHDGDKYQYQNPEVIAAMERESRGHRFMRETAQKTSETANATMARLPSVKISHYKSHWADRDNRRRSAHFGQSTSSPGVGARVPTSDSFSTRSQHHHTRDHRTRSKSPPRKVLDMVNNLNPLLGNAADIEAQREARNKLSEALFGGVVDELEDLTQEQRDVLVQRAFQHAAVRARRPVIWLPRDDLGVSDDEVKTMAAFSPNIWVSNVRQGLDRKGRCVYSGAPPDFSEVDLIQL